MIYRCRTRIPVTIPTALFRLHLINLNESPTPTPDFLGDSVRTGRSVDRIPVGARFSASVQTGPGFYPAYYTMGTGYFPGVKRLGLGVDHPPHLAPRFMKKYSYTTTPSLGLHGLF